MTAKKLKKKSSRKSITKDGTADKEDEKLTSPRIPNIKEVKEFDAKNSNSKLDLRKTSQPVEPNESLSIERWREYLEKNQSIVSDTFLGQYITRLECSSCKTMTIDFEPYYVLELPLPQGLDKISLSELLSVLAKEDMVEGSEWDCPKCKKKTQVKKTTQIYKLPPVLIIHYKRFELHKGSYRKNNCLVSMKIEGEDLGRFEVGDKSLGTKKYTPCMFIVVYYDKASSRRDGGRPLQLHVFRQPRMDRDRRLVHSSPQR